MLILLFMNLHVRFGWYFQNLELAANNMMRLVIDNLHKSIATKRIYSTNQYSPSSILLYSAQ